MNTHPRLAAAAAAILFLLTSCNLPVREYFSLEQADNGLLVACDTASLVAAMSGAETEFSLSPGCVYVISEAIETSSEHSATGLPVVQSELVIHGNGATLLRDPSPYAAERGFRFFLVEDSGSLILENLRLENGGWTGEMLSICLSEPACGVGGAISLSGGELSVSGCTFVGNAAKYGGAINHGGDMTIEGSTFDGNMATSGGAIHTASGCSSVISSSIFRNNQAQHHAGGILTQGLSDISMSLFDGNLALTGSGGAISVTEAGSGYVSRMNLSQSSVIHNYASNVSAIRNDGAEVNITNCTIAENSAAGDGARGWSPAGSVHTTGGGSTLIEYSTIANNHGQGPAVSSYNYTSMAIKNSIIAENEDGDCANLVEVQTAGSSNLDSDGSCTGFSITADPKLGPLAGSGGSSILMSLRMGSPAIDEALGDCPGIDQRGATRPEGDACDLGAYEWGMLHPGDELIFDYEDYELLDTESAQADRIKPDITLGWADRTIPCLEGPGETYPTVSSVKDGALLEVVGISENEEYIVVINPCYPGVICWADINHVILDIELERLQTVDDPPDVEEPDESGLSGEAGRPACHPDLSKTECEAAGGEYMETGPEPFCKCSG
jgi:hypothetical protein